MSITANQIKIYGCANIAENNTSEQGGGIDVGTRYIFADAALANDPTSEGGDGTLIYTSTNDADNGVTVTATGRASGGYIVAETRELGNSGVGVAGSQQFERILKVVAGAHSYNIDIEDSLGNDLTIMESGVNTVRRPFYNVSSSPNEILNYYEKIFVKNTNDTLSLLETTFLDGGGDTNDFISFAIATSVEDTESVDNRLTAPTGVGAFSKVTRTLEDEAGKVNLDANESVGVWLRMTLPQNQSPSKDTFTLSISGSTI